MTQPDHITFGRDTLAGLGPVAVVVERNLLPKALRCGLTADRLRAEIEERLFQGGVGVVALRALSSQPRKPVLYVRPSIIRVLDQGYCYGLNLYLMQQVTLVGGEASEALTWEHGVLGTVVGDDWQSLVDRMDQAVDAFISDYLSVNPPVEIPQGQEVH